MLLFLLNPLNELLYRSGKKKAKSFTSLRHNRLLDVPWTHQILDTLLPQGFVLVSSTQSTLQPDICRPCSLMVSELFSHITFLVSLSYKSAHHSTLLIASSTLSFHHGSYKYQKYYLTIYLINYCYLRPLEYISPSMQELQFPDGSITQLKQGLAYCGCSIYGDVLANV